LEKTNCPRRLRIPKIAPHTCSVTRHSLSMASELTRTPDCPDQALANLILEKGRDSIFLVLHPCLNYAIVTQKQPETRYKTDRAVF
jgi:hypothetical protein